LILISLVASYEDKIVLGVSISTNHKMMRCVLLKKTSCVLKRLSLFLFWDSPKQK